MGIHHLEFWVSDLTRSRPFYDGLFRRTGWKQLGERSYFCNETEIYFMEKSGLVKQNHPGPRHICLSVSSREKVDAVHRWLNEQKAEIIRGPVEMPGYSPGYYTVDFRDPDGYIWEVAYTPNMKWEEQE
ncbi:VOC family protein [Lihuaxuella thermophila]|uniref:VOC domain-containing protein n=1 Tax=Lihuaxuella thermophila TaxID=1173111 RepID=A0A1H8A924_9BACL|nr:VOC family protein [Lihuaxuella thermophila]SEM67392.1 hypothetical protein SAMN05444955_10123 [Lihuaxuella thermophila]